MARDRRYDLLLFGATGFTGQLVAEYLAAHAPPDLRWALAGRSQAKLEAVRATLAAKTPTAASLAIVIGDALDAEAMAALARDATAVCTTVGPYRRYGAALIGACAAAGTAYCDLTGEVPFVRDAIDRHHATAQATGARLVPCAGFDSIPSDLSVWTVQRALTERTGRGAPEVTAVFELRGGASGGTIASMFALIDDARHDRALRRLLANPYALDPQGLAPGPDRDRVGPGYDRHLGVITAPFIMAGVNARVVRRSHALAGSPWGRHWRYDECMSAGRALTSGATALALSAAMPAAVIGSQVGPIRAWLDRKLPAPGQGPSASERARGRYRVRAYGTVDGTTVTATFADQRDPGYDGTAVLLGESALALALDPPTSEGGVLTPATALAPTLVPRLRAAGLTIDVA